MNKKVIIAVAVLAGGCCLSLAFIAAAVIVLGGQFLGPFAFPQDVVVDLSWDGDITAGRPFEIVVEVQNEGQDDQLLDSIDIDAEFLSEVTITGSDPRFDSTTRYGAFTTYWYDNRIPPGESRITLDAVSKNPGSYPLRLDVCLNGPVACRTLEGSVTVR